MANRYVRLYEGPRAESTIVGFSASAYPGWENLKEFFGDRDYEIRSYDYLDNPEDRDILKKLGGVSFSYLGVQPPITDSHVGEFGDFCATHIDPYHNSGFLIDNRDTPGPLEPFDRRGKVISRW